MAGIAPILLKKLLDNYKSRYLSIEGRNEWDFIVKVLSFVWDVVNVTDNLTSFLDVDPDDLVESRYIILGSTFLFDELPAGSAIYQYTDLLKGVCECFYDVDFSYMFKDSESSMFYIVSPVADTSFYDFDEFNIDFHYLLLKKGVFSDYSNIENSRFFD